MSYIGRQLNNLSDRVKLDSITASATATYNLLLNTVAYVPSSAESLTVSLNGVIQAPQDSYTVSGSTITFASTLSASDSIDFILAERSITLQTPSSGSVNTEQLASGSVTAPKLSSTAVDNTNTNSTLITAQTEKTSLVDADKFLISDSAASGALKYVQKSNLPSGGLTLLSMIDQDLGTSNKIQFQQVFSSDYDYYKVIGTFNLGSNSAHYVEFRFLNSSNTEQTAAEYYGVAQGWRYSSSATDRSDWGQWGDTGIDIGRDINGGAYYRKIVLDMDIHPDAYASTTYSAFQWNMGYFKTQGGTEAVSRIMGYGAYAQTTDLSGGGIQLEAQNSYDFVTMGIYGVKTTT